MERLLRTRSGAFTIEESHSLAELEEIVKNIKDASDNSSGNGNDDIDAQLRDKKVLISADRCFMEYPALHCKEKYDSVLCNGNLMRMRHFKEYIEVPDAINRVYDSNNDFKALYEWVEERKLYRPVKVFISIKD